MKAEKTNGAKMSRFDVRDDYARILSENAEKQPPINPKLSGGWYVVAVGERLPPEVEPVYITRDGDETTDPQQAIDFDTYGDALKWTVENCEIPQFDRVTLPRGLERPRYPRVCYLRMYTEITEC